MIIFRLVLPLMIYDLVTFILFQFLPTGCSILLVTGIGALISSFPLYLLYTGDQKKRNFPAGIPTAVIRNIPYLILFAFAACVAVNNLILLSPYPGLFPHFQESVKSELYSPALAEQLLCTVLFIPAAEELCFRAHIYALLRDRFTFWTAALFSALAFGMFHGNAVQGLYGFLLGILLAWIYERFHSFWAAYLFHMAANFLSVLLTNTGWMDPKTDPVAVTVTLTGVALCVLILTGVLISLRTRREQ